MAGGLQHRACQQHSCQDGTRQLYDPPRHGHLENARSYPRPGNIRSVKEQADRSAEEAAKLGLFSKGQSAGETPAKCSEFQACGHWSSVDCTLGSQLGEGEAEVLTGIHIVGQSPGTSLLA